MIFASNQKSHLDPYLIFAALPLRRSLSLYFVGSARYRKKIRVRLLALEKMIYVSSFVNTGEVIESVRRRLEQNCNILLFPRGAIERPGEELSMLKGVGAIAAVSRKRVVPIYIHGSQKALSPEGGLLSPARVQIVFGAPIDPAGFLSRYDKKKDTATAITSAVEKEMARLKNDFLKKEISS